MVFSSREWLHHYDIVLDDVIKPGVSLGNVYSSFYEYIVHLLDQLTGCSLEMYGLTMNVKI